jgi:hypothetical protein
MNAFHWHRLYGSTAYSTALTDDTGGNHSRAFSFFYGDRDRSSPTGTVHLVAPATCPLVALSGGQPGSM